MRVLLLMAFALLLSVKCMAQLDSSSVLSQSIMRKVKKLKEDQIDTIVAYHTECSGCFIRRGKDSCGWHGVSYLFWRKKGKAFICMIDNCEEHRTIQIPADSFSVIMANYLKINKQKTKYDTRATNQSSQDSTMSFIAGDDTPHAIFDFYIRRRRITVDIDEEVFASTTTGLDPQMLNFLKSLSETAFNEAVKYDKSLKKRR